MLLLAVLTVLLFAAPGGSTGQTGETLKASKQVCKKAKPYISAKRTATWDWQDTMYVPRTRTAYREKSTRGCAYLRWIGRLWRVRANDSYVKVVELRDPDAAICHIFGSYCAEAVRVATCESGDKDGDLSGEALYAHNGQYLGMFQMGTFARSTYGHGSTALEQAYYAHRYFVASGRDWSPWGCKP